jgi:hypothetical protein
MHECIAVLVRAKHQVEATDQISTYMYLSESFDIGQWRDIDHENLHQHVLITYAEIAYTCRDTGNILGINST